VNTVPCPLCGTPVRTEEVDGRALAYEPLMPWLDTDELPLTGVTWLLHTEVRCGFAAAVAASGSKEGNRS